MGMLLLISRTIALEVVVAGFTLLLAKELQRTHDVTRFARESLAQNVDDGWARREVGDGVDGGVVETPPGDPTSPRVGRDAEDMGDLAELRHVQTRHCPGHQRIRRCYVARIDSWAVPLQRTTKPLVKRVSLPLQKKKAEG